MNNLVMTIVNVQVIGMYQTLLGRDGFRKGMDLYFKRHDGTAVTCDDFRAAMADANGVDLTQFERWYTQAGTPQAGLPIGICVSEPQRLQLSHALLDWQVKASGIYDSAAKSYSLILEQSCGPSPGQPTKEPYHIPIRVGLLGRAKGGELCSERVLELREARQACPSRCLLLHSNVGPATSAVNCSTKTDCSAVRRPLCLKG